MNTRPARIVPQRLRSPWSVFVVLMASLAALCGISAGSAAATASPLALRVSGNSLVDASGSPTRLIGVNYSGTEYGCVQGWGIFDGPNDLASVQAMATWHVNAVRLPLNEDCWLGINGIASPYSGVNYQQAIADYVALLHSQGIYAILELHWSAPGTTKATGQNPMPDASHSPDFWRSVATRFAADTGVVFDLFNEPYPDSNQDTTAAWTCWKNGGTCAGIGYQVAGMQSLVDAVRSTGATNVVMAGGVQYANSLSQWLQYKPSDPLGQLAASAHIYGNNACGAQNGGACLTNLIAPVALQVPVVLGEVGDSYDNTQCTGSNTKTIMSWADSHSVSYLAWTWDTWGECLSLISDFSGTVNTTTPVGGGYATFVHDHMAALAAAAPRAPSPDATAPSTPPSLAATASGSSVALSWGTATDNVAVTGYQVHRSSIANFAPSASTLLSRVTATSFSDTAVPAGTWHYRVTAVDSAGNMSLPSNDAGASVATVPTQDLTPPTQPRVTAAVQGSSVALGWSVATDNVGVTGYEVHRSTTAGFGPSAATLLSTTTAPNYTDVSVPAGTWYYVVVAKDAAGNSGVSPPVSVTVSGADTLAPTAPSGLMASWPGKKWSLSLTWAKSMDDTAVSGYDVYRSTSVTFTPSVSTLRASVTGTTFVDSGVSGGTYYYRVVARDAAGNRSAASVALRVVMRWNGRL